MSWEGDWSQTKILHLANLFLWKWVLSLLTNLLILGNAWFWIHNVFLGQWLCFPFHLHTKNYNSIWNCLVYREFLYILQAVWLLCLKVVKVYKCHFLNWHCCCPFFQKFLQTPMHPWMQVGDITFYIRQTVQKNTIIQG
jgi:hypothetical protein